MQFRSCLPGNPALSTYAKQAGCPPIADAKNPQPGATISTHTVMVAPPRPRLVLASASNRARPYGTVDRRGGHDAKSIHGYPSLRWAVKSSVATRGTTGLGGASCLHECIGSRGVGTSRRPPRRWGGCIADFPCEQQGRNRTAPRGRPVDAIRDSLDHPHRALEPAPRQGGIASAGCRYNPTVLSVRLYLPEVKGGVR
jgi:hypothetical protein